MRGVHRRLHGVEHHAHLRVHPGAGPGSDVSVPTFPVPTFQFDISGSAFRFGSCSVRSALPCGPAPRPRPRPDPGPDPGAALPAKAPRPACNAPGRMPSPLRGCVPARIEVHQRRRGNPRRLARRRRRSPSTRPWTRPRQHQGALANAGGASAAPLTCTLDVSRASSIRSDRTPWSAIVAQRLALTRRRSGRRRRRANGRRGWTPPRRTSPEHLRHRDGRVLDRAGQSIRVDLAGEVVDRSSAGIVGAGAASASAGFAFALRPAQPGFAFVSAARFGPRLLRSSSSRRRSSPRARRSGAASSRGGMGSRANGACGGATPREGAVTRLAQVVIRLRQDLYRSRRWATRRTRRTAHPRAAVDVVASAEAPTSSPAEASPSSLPTSSPTLTVDGGSTVRSRAET